MRTDETRALVERYFELMKTGSPALPALLADDVSWWVPPSSPLGGLHEGKAKVLALMGQGVALYDGPLAVTIESLIAEGDRAAAQLVIEGRTAKGEPYRNFYHFAFRARDGKICAVREYVDTLYAQQKLFR
jgi:ketosteroid isomerase-like protein